MIETNTVWRHKDGKHYKVLGYVLLDELYGIPVNYSGDYTKLIVYVELEKTRSYVRTERHFLDSFHQVRLP